MENDYITIVAFVVSVIALILFLSYVLNREPSKPKKITAPKRARNKKGQLKGDDPSTPNVNEAWVGGKAPAKKKRGRPKGSKNKPKK